MGLLGFPQAMLSFSQNDVSPLIEPVLCSSPMVPKLLSRGLQADGELVAGSGDVPHDELTPRFEAETEDSDGELYDVLWPVLL